jgi:WD40 repeat protein
MMRRNSQITSSRSRTGFAARDGFLSSLFGVELVLVILVLVALGAALVAGAEPQPTAASQQPDKSRPIRSITIAGADDRHLVVLTDACCYVRDLKLSETFPVWMRVESERATAVAGSPVDHRVLLCRDQRRMELLNAETGERLWSTALPRGDGVAAAFSPDASMIAIATDKKEVLIVESQSAAILRSFKVEESFHSVCFTPCGRHVVAPVSRDEISLWDVESGREVLRFPFPDGPVTSVVVHPLGKLIAVGTYQGTTLLMSLADGQVKREWRASHLPILNVVFSPNGQEVLAARCDGQVSVFSPEHDSPLRHFTAHHDAVRTMAFAGERLVTGGYDGLVRSWNVATTREISLDLSR